MESKSSSLTAFDISLMKGRGWDTDKQRLLDEIQRLRAALDLANGNLDSAVTAHNMLLGQLNELEAELKTIREMRRI